MAVRKSIHWPKNAIPSTIAGTVPTAVPLQLVVIEPPLTSLLDQQQQTQAILPTTSLVVEVPESLRTWRSL